MKIFLNFAISISLLGNLAFAQEAEVNRFEKTTLDLRLPETKRYDDYLNCKQFNIGCEEYQRSLYNRTSSFDKLMTSSELNEILSKDRSKGVFIPLSLNNQELLTLAAATSLGIVAFKNDQEITNVIVKNQSTVANTMETVGNFMGSGYAMAGIAAGSYFMGVVFEDSKLKQVGLFIVGAELAQSIVTASVKSAFGRVRPREDQGPYAFFEAGKKSFFSGHTATAFTLATVISEMYKDDYPVVPWVAYGVAAITAYARVHEEAHWASDVIMGAVAGHLIAKLYMDAFNKDSSRSGVLVYPGLNPENGAPMIYVEYRGKQTEPEMKCKRIQDEYLRKEACIREAFDRLN